LFFLGLRHVLSVNRHRTIRSVNFSVNRLHPGRYGRLLTARLILGHGRRWRQSGAHGKLGRANPAVGRRDQRPRGPRRAASLLPPVVRLPRGLGKSILAHRVPCSASSPRSDGQPSRRTGRARPGLSIRWLRVRVPSPSLNRSSRKSRTYGYGCFKTTAGANRMWGQFGGKTRVALGAR